MIVIKLAAVALVLFILFGGALFFVQLRKRKRKQSCGDEGKAACSICSCGKL